MRLAAWPHLSASGGLDRTDERSGLQQPRAQLLRIGAGARPGSHWGREAAFPARSLTSVLPWRPGFPHTQQQLQPPGLGRQHRAGWAAERPTWALQTMAGPQGTPLPRSDAQMGLPSIEPRLPTLGLRAPSGAGIKLPWHPPWGPCPLPTSSHHAPPRKSPTCCSMPPYKAHTLRLEVTQCPKAMPSWENLPPSGQRASRLLCLSTWLPYLFFLVPERHLQERKSRWEAAASRPYLIPFPQPRPCWSPRLPHGA